MAKDSLDPISSQMKSLLRSTRERNLKALSSLEPIAGERLLIKGSAGMICQMVKVLGQFVVESSQTNLLNFDEWTKFLDWLSHRLPDEQIDITFILED